MCWIWSWARTSWQPLGFIQNFSFAYIFKHLKCVILLIWIITYFHYSTMLPILPPDAKNKIIAYHLGIPHRINLRATCQELQSVVTQSEMYVYNIDPFCSLFTVFELVFDKDTCCVFFLSQWMFHLLVLFHLLSLWFNSIISLLRAMLSFLPLELYNEIFSYLGLPDRLNLRATCKEIKRALSRCDLYIGEIRFIKVFKMTS